MNIIKLLPFIGLGMLTGLVHAAIYKHIDANGRTTYSTTPIKGAKRITTDAEEKNREAEIAEKVKALLVLKNKHKHEKAAQQSAVISPKISSPIALPQTVDTATQKMRDTQRKRILMTELQTEMAMQQETQQRLAHERLRPNSERIKQLEEDLRVHHNNIEALQKEMRRI
jgi:hypothetical protein